VSLFPAGSTPWLIAHELRLAFRGRARTSGGTIVVLALVALPVVLGGVGAAIGLRGINVPIIPPVVMLVDAGLILVFSLMLSVTVSNAARVFFERGDLDLLLSSPVPGRRVLTARCVGMAVSASLFFLFMTTPFVVASAVLGRPDRLWIIGTLISLSLLATSVGLAIAMGLFALIGPRATKTLAQVLAAVIGFSFYLLSQASRFTVAGYGGNSSAIAERLLAVAKSGWFAREQPTAWPLRALVGEPIPAASILGGSILAFLLVTAALGGKFERDAAAAAGVSAGGRRRPKTRVSGFTGDSFQAMLRKEVRLLRRDIALMSQVLLRVLYLIPTMFVLWKGPFANTGAAIPAVAGVVVFLSGQIASSLGWITMSGEEGLELLAAAPAPARLLRRAKLVAIFYPLFWILLIPIGLIAWQSPQAGVAAAVGSVASAVSAGLIAIWYEKPAPRSQFLRRRRGGSIVGALALTFVSMFWASATGFAAGPWWMFAFAPAVLAVVVLLVVQKPQREFAETLQLI
jgi:ABC-2 type transport system permease protein